MKKVIKIINKNIDSFGFKYLNFKLLNKAFVISTNKANAQR